MGSTQIDGTQGAGAVVGMVLIVADGGCFAQGRQVPRTPDGKPDLQGIWDFRTITPLERPNQFAGKETLSAEEVAALEQRNAETRVDRAPRTGDPGTYNQFWFDFGSRSSTTSGRRSSSTRPMAACRR